MNKTRRAALTSISNSLDVLKIELEVLRDEEQDYYDNMPESFQNGDKGSAASESLQHLGEAIEAVETATDKIWDAST